MLLVHRDTVLALGATADGGAWNEIITSGVKWSSHRAIGGAARQESFTDDDIRGMAATFAQVLAWGPVAIDCNHATLFGAVSADDTKALGHILRVEVRDRADGVALWGFVEWTDEGRRRVEAGEFRGFSAEIVPAAQAVDKDTGKAMNAPLLTGGTCTNSPFWPGLAPLAASDLQPLASRNFLTDGREVRSLSETTPPTRQETTPMKTLALSTLAAALTLPTSDPTEASVMQALADQRRKAEAHDGIAADLGVSEARVAALTEERDAMRTDFDTMAAERVEALFTRCCSEGRLTPAKRAAFDGFLALTVAKPWAARVQAVEATWDTRRVVELGERGQAGGDPSEGGDRADVEGRILALAEKYEDGGMDARAAFDKATSKHSSELGQSWGGVGLSRAEA